jgi:multiple sugar transport system permease protein
MRYQKSSHRYTSKLGRNETITGILFVIPSLSMWLYWFLIPAIKSMRLSFYNNSSYINPDSSYFVGFQNYIRLFQDTSFLTAVQHSFFLVIIITTFLTVLPFMIASLLHGDIRGRTFFRTSYYMPNVLSSIAITTFFMYFFIKDGPGTKLFAIFGAENTTWFNSTRYAMTLVIFICVWASIGFYMILFIAGLQNISKELYEAAMIDGAGPMQTMRYITIPLLKTTTYLVVTLNMINTFQIFDQIKAISKQSPLGSPAGSTSTIVTFLYQHAFNYLDMGYGSAAAMILFLIIFVLSLTRMILTRSED